MGAVRWFCVGPGSLPGGQFVVCVGPSGEKGTGFVLSSVQRLRWARFLAGGSQLVALALRWARSLFLVFAGAGLSSSHSKGGATGGTVRCVWFFLFCVGPGPLFWSWCWARSLVLVHPFLPPSLCVWWGVSSVVCGHVSRPVVCCVYLSPSCSCLNSVCVHSVWLVSRYAMSVTYDYLWVSLFPSTISVPSVGKLTV